MNLFNLMKHAKDLKKIQNEISATIIEDEIDGAKLTLNGKGEVKNFEITQDRYDKGKEETQKAIAKVIESCYKKQVNLYKEKATKMLGGINLSDMLG